MQEAKEQKIAQEPLAPKDKLIAFYQLLGNTFIVSVINFTAWFAITFFVYLETKSVFATGMIAGIYAITTALTSFWFGSIVDHNKKKKVMLVSSIISFIFYIVCFGVYQSVPAESFKDVANPMLWVLVLLLMGGVLAGNLRNIALPTIVTILIPEDRRDKANGLVGSLMGMSMLVTSVISGILVGLAGMYYVLILGIVVTLLAMLHLYRVDVPEKGIVHVEGVTKKIDIKGTWKIVVAIPGLIALILFSTFNNFLGGVFMALLDAYGLSLVSVQAWGLLWGVLSTGFIVGGLLIAKKGLGRNPLKTIMIINIILWIVCIFFTIQSSIILMAVGMYAYMVLMPFVEAGEQTILQKVVPLERQGRVFGFAQSVEQAASPITAFLIGPIAQFIFIPLMTVGAGADLIGSWYGTSPERGIAIVFTLTGLIGLIVTLFAFSSRFYKQLSAHYLTDKT